ncbi:hypothetical protein RRG08_038484 [Elysia crispata]|uniref:Uncharacterized protein n=1 Tax=Elysia crispata TaxID=231223 RepID=A0AAE1AH82_9GAST|nr:hypothetical protein RRG08_038484 [Elysia crispata]
MMRNLDHSFEEGPGPQLKGGTWNTTTMRDLDCYNKKGPVWTHKKPGSTTLQSGPQRSWQSSICIGVRSFDQRMLVWVHKRTD